jgi:hypothetical protein
MEKQEIFEKVLKTLKNNKSMVSLRDDGIYIRLAGKKEKGEILTSEWGKVFSFQETKEFTETHNFAKQELNILSLTTPDSVVIPFTNEILALCEAWGKSGQSGGSAPYVAPAIAETIKKLLLFQPICDVTGHDSEWINVAEEMGKPLFQNSRCSALFKYPDGQCKYLNAIVWQGKDKWDTFTGRVYINDKDFQLITSSQRVKFPFTPKTYYIDVIRVPISKEEAESRGLHYIEDGFGECYYTILKNPKQLQEVFEYYQL